MTKLYLALFQLLTLVFAIILAGCEFSPSIEKPSYIHIPEITFSSNYPEHGTNSHKITDAWVYLNDNLIGAYQLPATFPVLAKDKGKIKVFPGVLLNGISSTRQINPFYTGIDFTPRFIPGQTDTLKPNSSYRSGTNFIWKEDFELPGLTIKTSASSDTSIQRLNGSPLVFEGNGALAMYVDDRAPTLKSESINGFPLPQRGSSAFLELDIKNTTPLYMAIFVTAANGQSAEVPFAGINPSPIWRKLYMNLTPVVNAQPINSTYKMVFFTKKEGSTAVDTVLIDNLKIVY